MEIRLLWTPPLHFLCRGAGTAPASGPLSPSLNFSKLTPFPGQLREAVDHDPFLLFSANLKRELAGEQLYRRALRKSGQRGSGEVGRLGLRAEGKRLPERKRCPGRAFPSLRVRPRRCAGARWGGAPGAQEPGAAEAGS